MGEEGGGRGKERGERELEGGADSLAANEVVGSSLLCLLGFIVWRRLGFGGCWWQLGS